MEHSFNIFPEIYLERREHATDPIEACTVTLARPIMASLQDGHFTCLNHGLMQQLGTIGQAFYMRLFFHFANLYDGHHQKRVDVRKALRRHLCRMAGRTCGSPVSIRHRARPVGAALAAAREGRVPRVLHHHRAKGRGGFVITFRPGAAFFADYDRFYRRRERATVQFDFDADQQQIAEPLKVAYLFVEKRNGRANAGIPYVSSKDVETAKYLLQPGPVRATFRTFSITRSPRRRRPASTCRPWAASSSTSPATRSAGSGAPPHAPTSRRARPRSRPPSERMDYDRFRRAAADRLFATPAAQEQAAIEAAAHAKAAPL